MSRVDEVIEIFGLTEEKIKKENTILNYLMTLFLMIS
jgi:hypothetical protein